MCIPCLTRTIQLSSQKCPFLYYNHMQVGASLHLQISLSCLLWLSGPAWSWFQVWAQLGEHKLGQVSPPNFQPGTESQSPSDDEARRCLAYELLVVIYPWGNRSKNKKLTYRHKPSDWETETMMRDGEKVRMAESEAWYLVVFKSQH